MSDKSTAWGFVVFLIFFHAMFNFFLIIGSFSAYASQGVLVDDMGFGSVVNMLGLTGFSGIATFGIAALTSIISVRAGLSPYMAIGFGVVMGLYINTWTKFFGIIYSFSSALGSFTFILTFFAVVLSIAFGYLVIRELVKMSTGGP